MQSLLLLSLIQITTCTVYIVTPDDHYYPNTTCHRCHNLQHYLLNITKYFTSNTQLLFLPGLHHLHTHLIIQNVHNISLIGSIADGTTPDTVLQSNLSFILIVNISTLTLKNVIINISHDDSPVPSQSTSNWIPLTIKNCSFVSVHQMQVFQQATHDPGFALEASNVMGESYFNHVKCYFGKIKLFYDERYTDKENHKVVINNCTAKTISIEMSKITYKITLKIINMLVQNEIYYLYSFCIHGLQLSMGEVLIVNCQFDLNIYYTGLFSFGGPTNAKLRFINCSFTNNRIYNEVELDPSAAFITLYEGINVEFDDCKFYNISGKQILLQRRFFDENLASVIIKNTKYTGMKHPNSNHSIANFISLSHSTLTLEGSVTFCGITDLFSLISVVKNSTIIISGAVNFSHNHVGVLINLSENTFEYIFLKENNSININHNDLGWSLFGTALLTAKYPYPLCFFQYFSSVNSTVRAEKRKFQIKFQSNQCYLRSCYYIMPIDHCLWQEKSLFNNSNIIPLEINNRYIQFINNSGAYKLSQVIKQSSLCVCTDELHYDCHVNDLGYLYPGQTLTVSLYYINNSTNVITVKTDINQQHVTPCIVLDVNENFQLIDKHCTKLHYTIGFPTDNWCELFLKIAPDSDDYLDIFYIRQITCPTGFAKIDKRCQCDPVLVQYGITNCNINDQTILRPANSWISATTQNNSYTYHISLHCPFHYCLPHSSHLDFSIPNSQCQFNRSGLLCGHCKQGLSTVFSSSHCQHCSSIYLLLIIPIAIAGVVLVLLLFVLNLTVTDGTINGFILYVNIISINTPVFFTELNHFTPTYTFISTANLDLGIQTCFYNGMDDYAKMWLQLAFPFYLIFIATLIIITSRYSTTIQRLTARRALPVLATLFLLSYTKILRIVSSVLFFYSTITHIPSKHTTLVWSVDANVPLFGVRFTILFIVCLILFLTLVPFNVILLFTRTLSRFRIINRFMPLLDAYQGPYKYKYYYWTGLQLLIRAVFFGISSLDRNINITVSILLLSVIIGLHGMLYPFKVKHKNYQEMLLFFNLHGLYVMLLYSQSNDDETTVNVAITVATVHFSLNIVYHIITYVCGGVTRNKIQLIINTFTGWVTKFHRNSHHLEFQLEDNIRDNIPEIAFNYREYREPLVAIDC